MLVLLFLVACQTVPLTGRRTLSLLPESDELQMGLTAYQEIVKKSKVSTDRALVDQVTRVGRRIATATGRDDFEWEYAFCLPGGKVAVYTGILPITRDDAGLAAVLGHEVAHAVARHGGERVSQQLVLQTGLAATQVALSRAIRW